MESGGASETEVTRALWRKPRSDTESSPSISSSESDREYSSNVSEYEDSEDGAEGEAATDEPTTTLEESWNLTNRANSDWQGPDAPSKLSKQELLRQCQLKQHIDKLEDEVKRKEDTVNRIRRQSYRCQEQQSLLLDEKVYLEEAMTGSACLGMIHGRISKLLMDIEAEKELEEELQGSLSKAEDELLEAQIALSQFDHLKEGAEKGEELWKDLKELEFEHRLQTETKLLTNAKKQEAIKQRSLKEQQEAASSAVEEYRKAGKKERSFLQAALSQHKAARAKEVAEEKHKQHLEKRMKAILSLKNSIANSEGTIQAKLLMKQEKEQKQQAIEEAERNKILEEKGVPEEHFLRKQRLEQFQNMLTLFKEKQKERKLNIVEKLLRENEASKRGVGKEVPQQARTKSVKRKRSKRVLKAPSSTLTLPEQPSLPTGRDVELKPVHDSSTSVSESEEPPPSDALDSKHVITIVEPEIRGLWDEAIPPDIMEGGKGMQSISMRRQSGEDDTSTVEVGTVKERRQPSKAQLMIMKKAMEKLKRSKISKQIAAGREFKGQAFSCKPAAVVFRNFDVGKVYSKKVRLTNVSYTVNRCQLEGVSNSIADFISVDFTPPGSMSAGMSCSMTITFSPQLNEDLDGEIQLVSQTGEFVLPVKCLTKKCLVNLDKNHFDFGSVYLGETLRQRVIVYNAGALTAEYTISAVYEDQPSPVPAGKAPPPQATPPPAELAVDPSKAGLSERSAYSIMSNVEFRSHGGSSFNLGVIPANSCSNKLKSKSLGLISLKTESEAVENVEKEEGKAREAGAAEESPGLRPEGESPGYGRRGSQSAPGESRSEMRPLSGGRLVDTPSISFQETLESESPAAQPVQEEEQSKHTLVAETSSRTVAKGKVSTTPTPPAFQVGGSPTGEVGPFGYYPIELVYTPYTVQEHRAKFIITFKHKSASTLEVTAQGVGVDFPVYVEQEEMHMRICMLDRLYQSSVILRNRSSTPLKVTFQVPGDLQAHLEVLPKHGLVQGEDSLAAQLKFKPKDTLLEEETAAKYYTPSDDLWRMPVQVGVAFQSHPVTFHVLAHVTPAEMTFNPSMLDFGWCTCQESVFCQLTISNTSILPQSFGFLNLPSFVDIQPNDGFGELLPRESIKLEVSFSAKKPKDYEFDLICKSGLDKMYRVGCRGRGVMSPLELSHNSIQFKPTVLGGTSSTRIHIRNPKLSRLNSAVIRGTAPPAGTKAFQFNPPAGSPISFSPVVGVVTVGESVCVEVDFSPTLSEESIREEATKLAMNRALEEERAKLGADTEVVHSPETTRKKVGKRHKGGPPSHQASPLVSSITSLGAAGSPNPPSSSTLHTDSRDPVSRKGSLLPTPEQGSELWMETYRNLLMAYTDECMEITIPCFVSNTVPADKHLTPTFQTEYTLYLEVTAPAVRPKLVLAHKHSSTVNFGSVGTGDVDIKTVTILNISTETLKLSSSLLNPNGPFQLRNALRSLAPQKTHNLLMYFAPTVGGKTYDNLILREEGGESPLLELEVVGVGVHPQVDVSLGHGEELCLDMGHAMARDVISKTFTLYNSSPLQVRYLVTMETQMPKKHVSKSFRACNYNGQPPFMCVPREGVVEGQGTMELRVFFNPDHQSTAYSDRLIVDYNGKCGCKVILTGQAWTNNMYVCLLKEDNEEECVSDDKESMIPASLPPAAADDATPPPPVPLLLMFTSKAAESEKSARRMIEIGSIKSNLVKKSTGDFSIDPQTAANPFAKHFTFDTMKGSVEAGSTKMVTVTFTPPKEPCSLVASNATLTLKGNMTQVFQLMLRALVT